MEGNNYSSRSIHNTNRYNPKTNHHQSLSKETLEEIPKPDCHKEKEDCKKPNSILGFLDNTNIDIDDILLIAVIILVLKEKEKDEFLILALLYLLICKK